MNQRPVRDSPDPRGVSMRRPIALAAAAVVLAATPAFAQPPMRTPQQLDSLRAQRDSLERELQSIAVVERKLMIPMRDGTRIQFDVYRPKHVPNGAGVPAIFVRTPYNMNFWDVNLGAPADMTAQLTAVKRGYAYVGANERGHFFSEGNYDILGPPLTDGVDEIQWIASHSWSNGKVGLIGWSSTARGQKGRAPQAAQRGGANL